MELFDQHDLNLNKPSSRRVYSVTDITRDIRYLLEERLPNVWIEGEISNFKRHTSGHLYFSLKDGNAQIACVMWRGKNLNLRFEPQDGMKVLVFGSVTVYERQGKYQLDVHRIQAAGLGDLQVAFEQLKQRLADEGLFDPETKKPLPPFPTRIGIVTSETGAALRDIVSVISRRFPGCRLVLNPVHVQGDTAAEEIAEAVQNFNDYDNVDLIIVGRGGGSLEDLWAFNEAIVAYALFDSRIPVISAVGHEIDFTIADFVADVRAPTPSAAAEMAVPDQAEIAERLRHVGSILLQMVLGDIEDHRKQLSAWENSWALRRPREQIREYRLRVDDLTRQLGAGVLTRLEGKRVRVQHLRGKLESIDPHAVLRRGYSITTRESDGLIVKTANILNPSERIRVRFGEGEATGVIESIREED